MSKMKKYLAGNAEGFRHQIFRYAVGGQVSTLVDFLVLIFLTDVLSVYYMFSVTIAFACSVLVSYFFNICWVFHQRKYDKRHHEVILFFSISVVGLLLTNFLMYFFTESVGLFYIKSKIVSATIVFVWNFVARKYLLFNN